MEGGKPTIVTNAEGGRTTPSVVAYTKTGERLVGQVRRSPDPSTRPSRFSRRDRGGLAELSGKVVCCSNSALPAQRGSSCTCLLSGMILLPVETGPRRRLRTHCAGSCLIVCRR